MLSEPFAAGVFGALVLCIKPESSLPVLQIPILHSEINYGSPPPSLGNLENLDPEPQTL